MVSLELSYCCSPLKSLTASSCNSSAPHFLKSSAAKSLQLFTECHVAVFRSSDATTRLKKSLCTVACFSNKNHVAVETAEAKKCSPLYDEFVEYAIREAGKQASLAASPLQEGLEEVLANDGKTVLRNTAFMSPKMRLFRVANLDGGESMQVLNMAIFPTPQYDLPLFCADFFSTSSRHIIVLDLNPLYDAEKNRWYKEKYYSGLMPLVNKYVEVLPWGQRLTTESLQFFSPLVIWTKLDSRRDVQEKLFPAFKEYLKVWMMLMDNAEATYDPAEIAKNRQAQHRYLLWRATKDPGRPLLHRLFGEAWSEVYTNEFLFNGVTTLGSQSFLDYFPEYRCADGSVIKDRSVLGKSCMHRPWDKEGIFMLRS